MPFIKIPIVRGFTEISALYRLIKDKNVYLAGGYVRWMCSQATKVKPFSDIDIFCKDQAAFEDLTKSFETIGLTVQHDSDVSKTYNPKKNESLGFEWKNLPKIQIIKPMDESKIKTDGSLQDIIDNFDYTICRIGLVSETEALADDRFLEDDKNNYLRVKNVHCSVNSIFRLAKYLQKGFRTKPIEVLKILNDWDSRDAEYKSKLAELIIKGDSFDETKENSGLSDEELALLYKMMLID